jgi:hypothetical protein
MEEVVDITPQIIALAGASTPEEAVAWVESQASEAAAARATLGSLNVVSVLMANGEGIGLQLPAVRHTPESLEAIKDALLQSAMQVGALAKAARKQVAARGRPPS